MRRHHLQDYLAWTALESASRVIANWVSSLPQPCQALVEALVGQQGCAVRLLGASQSWLQGTAPSYLSPWLPAWLVDLLSNATSSEFCSEEQRQALLQQVAQQLPGLRAQLLQAAAACMEHATQRQQQQQQQQQQQRRQPVGSSWPEKGAENSASCAVRLVQLANLACSTPVQAAELQQSRLHLVPALVPWQSSCVHALWLQELTRWSDTGATGCQLSLLRSIIVHHSSS